MIPARCRHLLTVPKLRSVEADPDSPETRLVLLRYSEECTSPLFFSISRSPLLTLPPPTPNPTLFPAQLPSTLLEFIRPYSHGFRQYTTHLDYEHWNAAEILHAVLPEELLEDQPTSYTQTGHIGE